MAAESGDSAVANVLRYGAGLLRRHGLLLGLVFVGLLLPLWVFGELADEIHEQEAIAFDEPILRFAHAMAREGFNEFFVFVSKIGYVQGLNLDLAQQRKAEGRPFSEMVEYMDGC